MIRYTCVGDVDGDCGVSHRTIRAAVECCMEARGACRRRGADSDRRVVAIKGGGHRVLTRAEYRRVVDAEKHAVR